MKITIAKGTYIIAVSGGVDSMVLLHILQQQPDLELVVAHFDHGIRLDSAEDRELVGTVASSYGLPYVYAEGLLGEQASEARAREARYTFLRQVLAEQGGQAIITAHHEDDVLETAILNLLRGTGSNGLTALRSRGDLLRPLLGFSKRDIREYAQAHDIQWREDSTNADQHYKRNFVRHNIVSRMTNQQRSQLLARIKRAEELRIDLASEVGGLLLVPVIPRQDYIMLPYDVSCEIMAGWLRAHNCTFDKRTVQRLVVQAKVALPGKRLAIAQGSYIKLSKEHITLVTNTATP